MITMKMKRALSGIRAWHKVILVFMLLFIAVAPPWAQAEIPRYINYQGKLTDADDNPVTGDVSITVRIYNAVTGGTALWTETQTVTVTRGIFSILLGNTTALTGLGFNEAYWYSVEVGSDGEMTPRQRLTAVAYAINADKLDGYDASQFLRADADTSLTGVLTVSGNITGSANGDITLDPTGTGNIVMKIDSTSGDFKVTDGTTNYVLVDNATGNVTIANDLTVSGTIHGSLASEDGDSTFTTITVTSTSDLRGNISNTGTAGAVTIADALTQTGSTNQVTFAGNVDANNGLDVTGALTVSGATTLSSALDMNSNIDLDYSGTSAALDVTQASTGPAAQFSGQRVIVGASEASNAYALSSGELYVQGDLEVDGTLYGNVSSSGTTSLGSTTLSSLTVSGASDLQGNVSDSGGAFTLADNIDVSPSVLTSGGTDDYALNIAQTLNDTGAAGGSDVYRGIKLNITETDKTGWDSVYLMDLQVGGTSKFSVDDSGRVTVATPTSGSHAVTKDYADAVVPASAGGWTDGGTKIVLLTSTDKVGIGTTNPAQQLEVSGTAKATTLTDGTFSVTGGAVTGATGNISMWTNDSGYIADDTSVPKNNLTNSGALSFDWADDEVADNLTISGGTIENTVIGATTQAAGTFSALTLKNTSATPTFTFTDSLGSDTLTYTSTAGYPFNFSDKISVQDIEIRGSSPAVLSFGQDENKVSLIYDPATDEIRFSHGTFSQQFRNLVKNASFEAFSAFEDFHSFDATYSQGGINNTTYGYQGGWDNFAPDDWDYVSGKVFQHSPLFFKTNFTTANISSTTYKQDFSEGRSAVRLAAVASTPGKISQTISGLKPSTVYSLGVMVRVEGGGLAKVDIENEDGENANPTDASINAFTTLGSGLNTSDTSIPVASVASFPAYGTIKIDSERIRYEGLDNSAGANKFLKCTRAADSTTAAEHTSGTKIIVAPFIAKTESSSTVYIKKEGQFATNPKATNVKLVLSAETGIAYFDVVQIVAGGTVPEYTPSSIVDTGDQTIYGTLRLGRSSDQKGGILAVDQYIRTRGIDFFETDPGISGASGGGGSIQAPWTVSNKLDSSRWPTVSMQVMGNYVENVIRKFEVAVQGSALNSPYDPPYVKYRYQECFNPMQEWDINSWGYVTGGVTYTGEDNDNAWSPWQSAATMISTSEQLLAYGIKIKFTSSAVADFKTGDRWRFKAFGMTPGQATYDAFDKNATYRPGQTRIYKDPTTNELTFEDSKAGKVKLSEIISQKSTGYVSLPVRDSYNQGTADITAGGSLAGFNSEKHFEVYIENATSTPKKFGWWIRQDYATGTASTEYYGAWGREYTDGGTVSLIADRNSNGSTIDSVDVDTGITITFPATANSLQNSDRWTFYATPGSAANVAAHGHANSNDGGAFKAFGTTQSSWTVGNATDPLSNNIILKFGQEGVNQKSITWNSSAPAKFEINGNVQISGTLSATDGIAGVDTSAANEFNSSMSWNDATNQVSVTDAGGAKSVIITGFLESEADTLNSITGRGAITTNAITTGTIQTGANTADGQLKIYSEQGTTDYTATLNPNATMTSNASFYLPADEPVATRILNMDSTGIIGFDTNTYLTVESDPSALKTAGVDNVKDTHIDWGIGAGQVSTDDMTEGATNLYYTDTRVDTRLDTDQTIAGTWIFSNQVTIPQTPVSATDAASKAYVDAGIAGLSWKEAVLSLIADNTAVPPTEISGDRYLLSKTGGAPHANWDGASAGDMVQFNGATWVKRTPIDGDAVFVEDVDAGYVYTGTAWTPFTGTSAYTWGNGLSAAGTTVDVGVTAPISVDATNIGLNYDSTDFGVNASNQLYIKDTGIVPVEADTLATVTSRGAITTNAITAGNIQSGSDGADGALKIYSEQGATDYTATLSPNAAMTSSANFYLPADEPAAASILTMTSTGVIGFDANTYLTVESDPSALKTAGTDNVKDTHIDWGIGAGQVSTDDMTEGAANLYYTNARVDAQLDTNQTITGAWAFSPGQITAAGSDDKLVSLTQTLNDTSADAGTQAYTGIKYSLTETDKTGWDSVNLMDLQAGAAPVSKFKVDDSGNTTIAGSLTIGSTALSEANLIDLTDAGATILHTHTGLAPGPHAAAHQTGGSDLVYWDSLSKASGDATTVTSQISSDISTHAALTATHGATGAVVGTTNIQTLTNKTFSDGVNLATSSGNVGIGTTVPGQKLHITGGIKAAADATATSDGTLYLGNDGHYLMWDDDYTVGSTVGWLYTDTGVSVQKLDIRGASPATITFGSGADSKQLQFDPTTQEFSFSGGTLKQTFQNLIRNGSFESYKPGGWENHNTTWGTDMDIITDSSTAKFDSKYLRIQDNSASLAKGMRYRVPMPDRVKGENITLSVWARSATGTSTASIGYSYAASSTDAIKAKNISLTTTWQNFTWTFPDVVSDITTLEFYIYLYGAGVNNPNADGIGTITGAATNSGYVYFDGITLVQGKLSLDYGPTPVLDTGNQVIYGNLAIGANTDPTIGSDMPTLIFGEPAASFYYSGYGGWSMESGQIMYENMGGGTNSGRFMFNKPIRIYPMGNFTGFYLGDSGVVNYANNRTDAYIQGKLEVDGGFYGDGSNLTGLSGAVQLNATGALENSSGLRVKVDGSTININGSNQLALTSGYSDGSSYDSRFVNVGGDTMTGDLTLNQNSAVADDVYFNVQHNASNIFSVDKDGDVYIKGNLTTQGQQIITNTITVDIQNNKMVLNTNQAGSPTQNASIMVERGTSADTAIRWNESSDAWDLTNDGTNYYTLLHSNTAFGGDVSGTASAIVVADDSHSHTASTLPAATSYLGQTIGTGEIEDSAVTSAKIADSTITTSDISDGTIGNADIAANANIAQSKLNLSITNNEVAANADIAWSKINKTGAIASDVAAAAASHSHTDTDIADDLTIASTKAATLTKSYTGSAAGSNTYTDHVVTRAITGDAGIGNTWTVDGPVMTITNADTQTSGTLVDNSTLLKLKTGANAGASGYFIDAQNSSGTPKFRVDASGNVTVAGDLNVTGGQTITGTTQYQGAQTITATSATAFLVENGAGTDAFIVDTSTPKVLVQTNLDVAGTLKAGTNDAYQVASNGAVTSVGLNAGSGLITTSGNITTTGAGVMTSAGLLTAGAGINVSGGNIAITDSSNIVLNTNKITLYGATGNATLAGALTQLRSLGFTPDYDNAALSPDGSDNFGTMSVKYANPHNYYEWTTNEPTTQDYDIVIRYRLPDGFSSFDATAPIKLWNNVSDINGGTKVTVSMLDTGGTAVDLNGADAGTDKELKSAAWTESTLTISGSPTFTAGGYITITIKMSADQGKVADVGELTLKGNW